MTHTTKHHSVETTERWRVSTIARLEFLEWAGRQGPLDQRCRAQLVLLGWMPQRALDHFGEASTWIATLHPDSRVARHLAEAMLDEWIGTAHEHTAFHRLHGVDPCAGCWLGVTS